MNISWTKAFVALVSTLLLTLAGQAYSAEYEEVIYYHNDALGSPIVATDQNGDVLWREEYTPYGSRLTHEARETDCSSSPCLPVESPWDEKQWYTGKLEETRNSIQYYGARWYEPEIGRFLSVDPVDFNENNIFSFNRYAYANNNPYRYVDPDGREVRVQSHRVVGDNYHTLIRITPNNQQLYSADPRFNNIDAAGRQYATLGAGPVFGRLVSEVNRSNDVGSHETGNLVAPPNNISNEDVFIDRLFELDSNYRDNLDYDLFPERGNNQKWWKADDGYNSNSYTSGVVDASGGRVDPPNQNTPGWNKPIPESEFQ